MSYEPRSPFLLCPCGRVVGLPASRLVEPDTGEYRGAIWQAGCPCGRSLTVEVAGDPQHPATPARSRLRERRGGATAPGPLP